MPCLLKYNAMKTYGGVDVKPQHWVQVSGQLHAPAASTTVPIG